MLGYSGGGFRQLADELVDYEAAGLDLVVVPEAYSFDAVSRLGYLAARTSRVQLASGVMQLYTRTPALTAMTAASLDHLSGGRFSLGLGTSGPQVIEGFHGVAYDAPLARTREVVQICRQVWRREPLVFHGDHYRVPLPPHEGTGLGKPLKLINRPLRARIPILLGAIGPRSVALAAEIADGWYALFFDPESAARVWGGALADGLGRRAPELGPLDVLTSVPFAITDRPDTLLDGHREQLARYIGGMGARGRNFSNDLIRRYGYTRQAELIQDLYLNGRKADAAAAIPDELAHATALVGTVDHVQRRLAALAAAGITSLLVTPVAPAHADRLKAFEQLRELAPVP